jgi:uncharacterized membrane protein
LRHPGEDDAGIQSFLDRKYRLPCIEQNRRGTYSRGALFESFGDLATPWRRSLPSRDGQNSYVDTSGARWPWPVAAVVATVGLVAAPVFGWLDVVRLPAVVVPALLSAAVVWRFQHNAWPTPAALHRWEPTRAQIVTGAATAACVLGWIVLTRFWSGELNAVDFTVYFDRPCYQTTMGRPLFIETADDPLFSFQGQFAHHAYWNMFLVCAPYFVWPSPYWLLAITVAAPIAGAIYVRRIMRTVGVSELLAAATAVAFLVNDNTARALNYGFHPELLYAWLIPWMFDAGLGRRRDFFVAAAACVLVKEDSLLAVAAVSMSLGCLRWRQMTTEERWAFLAAPVIAAGLNLWAYYEVFLPLISAEPAIYGNYWDGFGATPWTAVLGMMAAPGVVLGKVLGSGFWTTVLLPHLMLPLVGWRWSVGTLPIVALYASSSSEQLRSFSVYYAIVLVPFLAIASSVGAQALARRVAPSREVASVAAAALVLFGALAVGSGDRGYSMRRWSSEVATVDAALARVQPGEQVLVQSAVYPHVGYDARLRLLTPSTLADPANVGTRVILAPRLGAFPFGSDELEHHPLLETVEELPGGLVLARVAPPPKTVVAASY